MGGWSNSTPGRLFPHHPMRTMIAVGESGRLGRMATQPAAHARTRILGISILDGVLPLPKTGFGPEIVAGLTLAAIGIPEVMGYTKIAGMPVITGLYTILLPIAIFAVLGSSRHLVVGADSATAAIMAAGLAGMAAVASPQYVALAGMLALITAGVLLLARLLRLGFVADFLSRSVLIGFLTGVGIQVAMGQVAGMLGVSDGSGGTIRKFFTALGNIPDASGWTVLTSAFVIAVIVGCRMINKKIPGALIAVVGSIIVSWAADLSAHGVSDLGKVPGGLPDVSWPSVPFGDVPQLVATAISLFIVILAQSAATSRAYGARYEEHVDENTDMIGLGAANIGAGFTGAFVVNGSPTKTEIADSAGARTQIACLTTAAVVLVVLLFLTKPLQYLPNCVLSSVVFLIGIQLVDIAGMHKILRTGHVIEFAIATVTAVTVVGWGVEQGIILAIILSILAHLRRSYSPRNAVLSSDSKDDWVSVPVDPVPQARPGLVVYRWGGSLYFANSARFEEQVTGLAEPHRNPVKWLCVDAVAMGEVDYTGGEVLIQVNNELKERGVRFVLAGVGNPIRKVLDTAGVTAAIGEDAYYPSVVDVMQAYDQK
jgi:sulfate permease, SulP family